MLHVTRPVPINFSSKFVGAKVRSLSCTQHIVVIIINVSYTTGLGWQMHSRGWVADARRKSLELTSLLTPTHQRSSEHASNEATHDNTCFGQVAITPS